MEVVYIFFWAALISLQARFFCIIAWSRPVIAMVTKIPEMNCLTALVPWLQSQSNQLVKVWPAPTVPAFSLTVPPTTENISPKLQPMFRQM